MSGWHVACSKRGMALRPGWLLLACGLLVGGCAADDGDDTEASEDAVIGGAETLERPEVGAFKTTSGLCTGTLVRPNVVVTAAHCYDGKYNGDVTGKGWQFEITTADRAKHAYPVVRAQAILRGEDFAPGGEAWRAYDIALLQLGENVPTSIARPATLENRAIPRGAQVALYGYGCTDREVGPDGRRPGAGTKRTRKYTWQGGAFVGRANPGHSCFGDSGGPFLDVGANAVMGVVSTASYYGDIQRNKSRIDAVLASWRVR